MFEKANHALAKVEDLLSIVSSVFLFFLVIIVVLDIGGRIIINTPLPGARNIATTIILPVVIFFMLSSLHRTNGNVNVDLFEKYIGNSTTSTFQILADISMLVILGYVIIEVQELFWNAWGSQSAAIGVVRLPPYLIWSIFIIGIIFLMARILLDIISVVRRLKLLSMEQFPWS